MMSTIGVDCSFAVNGTVRVRRIQIGGKWYAVQTGRQWMNPDGRHILLMLHGNVREIVLRPDTLTWEILPQASDGAQSA